MATRDTKRIIPDWSRLPDGDLVVLYRDHESRTAFETLIRRHEATLLMRVVELADDTAVALRLYRAVVTEAGLRISSLRDPDRFAAWLLELADRRAEALAGGRS